MKQIYQDNTIILLISIPIIMKNQLNHQSSQLHLAPSVWINAITDLECPPPHVPEKV